VILIHHSAPQGSPEWLAARRGLITGSRARDARERKRDGSLSAAALGYAQDLARERCGGLLMPVFQTAHMRLGSEQEPAAREAYEIETGNLVTQCGLITDADMRYGVSPDGLVGEDGMIEIKTMCSSATLFKAVVAADHSEYIDQIEMELWLTGRRWCDLVLWAPDLPRQLWIRRIWRDEVRIAALASDLTSFAALVDDLAQRLATSLGRDWPEEKT
jgi:predicted phage-related endonuclease